MAGKTDTIHLEEIEETLHHHALHTGEVTLKDEAHENEYHVNLTWRSWLVVFITCFA